MAPKRKAENEEGEKPEKRSRKPAKAAEEPQQKASAKATTKRKQGAKEPVKEDAGGKQAKKDPKAKANKDAKEMPAKQETKAAAKKDAKGGPTKRKPKATAKKGAKEKPAEEEPKNTSGKDPEVPSEKAAKKTAKDSNRVEPVSDPGDIPPGLKRDKRDRLVFSDHPEFRPTLTPKQVIQAGSFGGIYFNPTGGRKSIKYPDGADISADEFPKDWFAGLKDEKYKGRRYNVKLNRYGVKSGQNQQQWEEQGWIRDQDPRGWFQWYCRFITGRRTEDDRRQISRWTGVAGPKGRWKTRLFNTVRDKGGAINDKTISPVIRQNLLHWAYELTERDYNAMLKGERY